MSEVRPFKKDNCFKAEITSFGRLIPEKHSEPAGFWQQKEKTEGIAIFTVPTVAFHISLHRARKEQDQTKATSKFTWGRDEEAETGV